jgi:hypothetical protein
LTHTSPKRFLARSTGCALATALALVFATAAGAASEPKPGALTLHPSLGAALPVEKGAALVHVQCRGDDPCQGRLRLLPRGFRARAFVGGDAIASRSVTLKAGEFDALRLKLSQGARDALRNTALRVTIELTSKGRKGAIKEPSAVYLPKRLTGHTKPDGVSTATVPNAGGGTDTVVTYSWGWDLKAGSVLFMPTFSCPSNVPNVTTNGKEVQTRKTFQKIGQQGNLQAQASDGVGYAGFKLATTTTHTGSRGNYPDFDVMTGWPAGTVFANSIWAPLTKSGTFNLTVTCTDSSDRSAIAYVDHGVVHSFLFPWANP